MKRLAVIALLLTALCVPSRAQYDPSHFYYAGRQALSDGKFSAHQFTDRCNGGAVIASACDKGFFLDLSLEIHSCQRMIASVILRAYVHKEGAV